MIKSNLYGLLRQHGTSINKLSKETGISRQTLTALVNNDGKGIQFETVDTLLNYFDISIEDLLVNEHDNLKIVFDSAIDDNFKENNRLKAKVSIQKKTYENPEIMTQYSVLFDCELVKSIDGVVYGCLFDFSKNNETYSGHSRDGGKAYIEHNNEKAIKVFRQTMDLLFRKTSQKFSLFNGNLLSAVLIELQTEEINTYINPVSFVQWESSITTEAYPDHSIVLESRSTHYLTKNSINHLNDYHEVSGLSYVTFGLSQF